MNISTAQLRSIIKEQVREVLRESIEEVENDALNAIYQIAETNVHKSLSPDILTAFRRIKDLSESLVLMAGKRQNSRLLQKTT